METRRKQITSEKGPFELPAGRLSSRLLHDALLIQKSCGSRFVLHKSQWQAEISWFQSQPSLSIRHRNTPHSVHKEQPTVTPCSTGPDSCRDVWSVPHIPNLTAGHCELWPLVFKKKETVSWIAASYHCHSCLNLFKSRKKCRRSLLPQPQRAWELAGAVTGMQIFPDTSFSVHLCSHWVYL